MTAGCDTDPGAANKHGEHLITETNIGAVFRTNVRLGERILAVIQGLWRPDAAEQLCRRTKKSLRACEYLLARRNGMSLEAFVRLMQSEEGIHFLEAAMGDARPSWWVDLKRQHRIAELQRRQRKLRQELDGLTGE